MPEHEALTVNLGDGFFLIAAGIRRDRHGALAADLILQNGRVLYSDQVILNTEDGPRAWATRATAEGRPTAERMADAMREYLLPDALKVLQEQTKKPTQADDLVCLILGASDSSGDGTNDVEMFHTPDHTAYATFTVGTHRETWAVRSKPFRMWLSRQFYEKRQKTPGSQALADAVNVLEGKALYEGQEQPVFTRLALLDGRTYLDLTDSEWRAVEIDADGWRIVVNPLVKFRRARGMLALPVPAASGSLDDLRAFINVRTDDDWRLVVGWLLGAFRSRGPYPILIVHGEQGSAKSTLSRILRALIDPNEAPIRSAPRDERDLAIAATNGWCLAFDNISHIPDWLSDAYCRLATGGGFATRTLYENDEETIFNSQRPIILNGIEEIATRGDLLDRAIIIYLPTIPHAKRRTERDLWSAFDAVTPSVLGALLSVVAGAIANEAATVLPRLPRMADFGQWVTAAESTLAWPSGSFLNAYLANRSDANDLTLDASLVSQAIREWAATLTDHWESTATELLKLLDGRADEKTKKLKAWPDNAAKLSNALRRLAPNLRSAGTDVTFPPRKHGGRRVIHIEQADI